MPLATLLNCSPLIPSRVISHADWERQQQDEPTCHARRRYITIGRPSALPADFLSCYPSHNQPPLLPCGLLRSSISSPGTTRSVCFGIGLRLSPTRGVAPLLQRHGVPQGSPRLVQGRQWLVVAWKKNSASTTEDGVSLAQILDDAGPFKLPLFPARYTTSTGAVRGSWCLQVHVASAFSQGVQRKVADSGGAAVIS